MTVLSAEHMGDEKIPESSIQNLYSSVRYKASNKIEEDLISLGFLDWYRCSNPSITPLIRRGHLPNKSCGYGVHFRFFPTKDGKNFLKEYHISIKI